MRSSRSTDLNDPESVDLLDHFVPLPAFDVVQNNEAAQIASEFVIHLVDRLELLPDAADGVVERHVNAVVVVAGELAARVDAVARDDPAPGLRLDDHELLTDRMSASQPDMYAGQNVILVAVDQRDAMGDRGVER